MFSYIRVAVVMDSLHNNRNPNKDREPPSLSPVWPVWGASFHKISLSEVSFTRPMPPGDLSRIQERWSNCGWTCPDNSISQQGTDHIRAHSQFLYHLRSHFDYILHPYRWETDGYVSESRAGTSSPKALISFMSYSLSWYTCNAALTPCLLLCHRGWEIIHFAQGVNFTRFLRAIARSKH